MQMYIHTKYRLGEIEELLASEIEPIPGCFSLRVRRTSPVCGVVHERGFELRNSIFPVYSLRILGAYRSVESGTHIRLRRVRPGFPHNIWDQLLLRYAVDERVITIFLRELLEAPEH